VAPASHTPYCPPWVVARRAGRRSLRHETKRRRVDHREPAFDYVAAPAEMLGTWRKARPAALV
jgi:hypothetical protein